ncbi:MAG: hypothetical protein EOO93_17210, partial [Pedobacter sp.]
STSLLRSLYLPSYTSNIKRGNTSSPIPEVSLPLEDGPVVIKNKMEEQTFIIKGGVVEVLKNKIVVLAEGVA